MRAKDFVDMQPQPNLHDLTLAAWVFYSTTPDNVDIDLKSEPIDKFIPQAKGIWNHFKKQIGEKRKVESMISTIKANIPFSLPVYVKFNDPTLYVVEGRHRLCAYWLSGAKTIPVAYVKPISQDGSNLVKAPPLAR